MSVHVILWLSGQVLYKRDMCMQPQTDQAVIISYIWDAIVNDTQHCVYVLFLQGSASEPNYTPIRKVHQRTATTIAIR